MLEILKKLKVTLRQKLSMTKDFKLIVRLSQLALSLSKACSEPFEEGRLTMKSFRIFFELSHFDYRSV